MNFDVTSRFEQEDFCRLCMCSIYELHALFPKGRTIRETNSSLVTKINLLAEIIIVPSEELNARICSRCIQQLEDFDSFRRRCKDSDSQIRQIRAFRQSSRVSKDSVPNVSVPDRQGVTSSQKPSGDCGIGGIFNSMQYCVDMLVPGEYRMLYDGCVYRRESLFVWRCELAICWCKLLVQRDCSKLWVYGAHNHGKIPLDRDERKFESINQRISEFLSKLCRQINETIEHGSSAPYGFQQMPVSSTQPATSMPKPVCILYSTGRDRPTIVVNGQQYYKEVATTSAMHSQINWRCSEKNCLGMIMTAADLSSFAVLKSHNHEPSGKAVLLTQSRCAVKVTAMVRGAMPQCAVPAERSKRSDSVVVADRQVSVAPHAKVSGSTVADNSESRQQKSTGASKPNEASKLIVSSTKPSPILRNAIVNVQPTQRSEHPPEESAPMVTSTEHSNESGKNQKQKSVKPRKKKLKTTALTSDNSSSSTLGVKLVPNQGVQFYRSEARTYYMRFDRRFYYKDFADKVTSPDLDIVWRCVVKNCVGSMTVRANLKADPGPAYHNHGFFTGDPDRLTMVSPLEALQKLPIVPNIAFCRNLPTQGFCLLYKRYTYSLHLRHLANGFFIWRCNTVGCSGWMHSGTEFEYLIPGGAHNHVAAPESTVDVEHHISVQDALRSLSDLKNRSQNTLIASLSETSTERVAAEAEQPPKKKACIGPRRKSTWC